MPVPGVELRLSQAEVSMQPLRSWQRGQVGLQLQAQPQNQQAVATAQVMFEGASAAQRSWQEEPWW
jgi:hypothetical protein